MPADVETALVHLIQARRNFDEIVPDREAFSNQSVALKSILDYLIANETRDQNRFGRGRGTGALFYMDVAECKLAWGAFNEVNHDFEEDKPPPAPLSDDEQGLRRRMESWLKEAGVIPS